MFHQNRKDASSIFCLFCYSASFHSRSFRKTLWSTSVGEESKTPQIPHASDFGFYFEVYLKEYLLYNDSSALAASNLDAPKTFRDLRNREYPFLKGKGSENTRDVPCVTPAPKRCFFLRQS